MLLNGTPFVTVSIIDQEETNGVFRLACLRRIFDLTEFSGTPRRGDANPLMNNCATPYLAGYTQANRQRFDRRLAVLHRPDA